MKNAKYEEIADKFTKFIFTATCEYLYLWGDDVYERFKRRFIDEIEMQVHDPFCKENIDMDLQKAHKF